MDSKEIIQQIYSKTNGIGPITKQQFLDLIDQDPRILCYILFYRIKKDRLYITYRPNFSGGPGDILVDHHDGFFTLYPSKDNEKIYLVSRHNDFIRRFNGNVDSEIGVSSFSYMGQPSADPRYKIYIITPHFDSEHAALFTKEYTEAKWKANEIARELTGNKQLPSVIKVYLAMNYMKRNYRYDFKSLPYINELIDQKQPLEIGKHHSSNSYGAFYEGVAVCSGLTHSFNRILKAMGIEAKQMTGNIKPTFFSKGGPHSWSAVYISGRWYHCDVTAAISGGNIFNYLLKTNDQIAKRYQWNKPLPDCSIHYDSQKIKDYLVEHRAELQKKGISIQYIAW